MSEVRSSDDVEFDSEVPVLIVGAGAAGLIAALTLSEAGIEPVVVERDAVPSGSTALSAGLIPAAGTRFQRAQGIEDSAKLFADDIARKAHGEADAKLVRAVAEGAGRTVEWLADSYDMPFEVIADFNYPGHSAHRMHGLPSRTGAELIDRLRAAAEAREHSDFDRPRLRHAVRRRGRLHRRRRDRCEGRARNDRLRRAGARLQRLWRQSPNWCGASFPKWARRSISAIRAIRATRCCGARRSGARLGSLSGYQGHGSVATPHNILITWAAIMEGGFQVNRDGKRFSNEARGYSEAAAEVLRQPGGIAFDIFDARIAGDRAAVRGFQERRESRSGDQRGHDRGAGGAHRRAGGRACRPSSTRSSSASRIATAA